MCSKRWRTLSRQPEAAEAAESREVVRCRRTTAGSQRRGHGRADRTRPRTSLLTSPSRSRRVHVLARRHRRERSGPLLRAGDDRQRARPAADRRVEGQRRAAESDVPLQSGAVLGLPKPRTRRQESRRSQQSGWRRLDRHLSTALRTSRHAGAVDGRPDRVAWLRAPHELGCAEARVAGTPGTRVVFTP